MSIRYKVNKSLRSLEKPYKTLSEITLSRQALLHNYDFFSALDPEGHTIPVLKSNAYGHGIMEIASILKARSFPYIAIDGYYEALAIREVSKQPVLVMGSIHPDNYKNIDLNHLAFVVHDLSTVAALADTGKTVKVHIEIDTGMTRHGVSTRDLPIFLEEISKYPNLIVEGVMSHLADADNPSDSSYTIQQTELFDSAVELILESGFNPTYIHLAQSAGSTKVKSKHANAMRVGIALYGINPLSPSDPSHQNLQSLRPVLSLTSTITKVNVVESGTSVSYGRTYQSESAAKIGVLPLGYFEGIPRELSNIGSVEYESKYLPIVGRVCMNHTMLNLKDTDAKKGGQVTIISRDKNSQNSLDNISHKYNLFNYSLLTGLSHTIRRKIVD